MTMIPPRTGGGLIADSDLGLARVLEDDLVDSMAVERNRISHDTPRR
jgi:hypothetical protein